MVRIEGKRPQVGLVVKKAQKCRPRGLGNSLRTSLRMLPQDSFDLRL